MAEKDNLQIAREGFEAWSAHDADRWAALLSDDYVSESDTLPAPVRGRDGARQVIQMYLNAFPDLRLDVEQMLASGDYVISRWRATGTHRGELMGIAPTNRSAETHGCTVAEHRSGKIVHDWVYWDTGNLLRQLGVMPTPGQATVAR